MPEPNAGFNFPDPVITPKTQQLTRRQSEIRLYDQAKSFDSAYQMLLQKLGELSRHNQRPLPLRILSHQRSEQLDRESLILRDNLLHAGSYLFQAICNYAYASGCFKELNNSLIGVPYITLADSNRYTPTDLDLDEARLRLANISAAINSEKQDEPEDTLVQAAHSLSQTRELLSCLATLIGSEFLDLQLQMCYTACFGPHRAGQAVPATQSEFATT